MEHLFNWLSGLAYTALCGIGLLWLVIFFFACALQYIRSGRIDGSKAASTASKVLVTAVRFVASFGKRRRR